MRRPGGEIRGCYLAAEDAALSATLKGLIRPFLCPVVLPPILLRPKKAYQWLVVEECRAVILTALRAAVTGMALAITLPSVMGALYGTFATPSASCAQVPPVLKMSGLGVKAVYDLTVTMFRDNACVEHMAEPQH